MTTLSHYIDKLLGFKDADSVHTRLDLTKSKSYLKTNKEIKSKLAQSQVIL